MIWLIGTGPMASAYAEVLVRVQAPFLVVGRDRSKTQAFAETYGVEWIAGGTSAALAAGHGAPRQAIVAVTVDALASVTIDLINHRCRSILVEKPGGLNGWELARVSEAAAAHGADVRIAYNRRFFDAVQAAKTIITEQGPVTSAIVEFDEPVPRILELPTPGTIKAKWGLANASHVLDLMAFLCGEPIVLQRSISGPSIAWHPSGSVFTGSGKTENGAAFVYHGNYASVGRWRLTVSIPNRRLVFCPIESLRIVEGRSVQEVEHTAEKSDKLKPGLHGQVVSFLDGKRDDLVDIHLQAKRMGLDGWMARIFGYDTSAQ